MHAPLMPSYYLERVASTRTMPQGEPLRARAERLRTPLFEPGGALCHLTLAAQSQLQAEAIKLADVCRDRTAARATLGRELPALALSICEVGA
jgi:hypothetical protein